MKHKTDFFLKLSDYFVAVLIGSLSAVAIYFVVSASWSVPAAMLAGMALGMVVMTVTILPFSLVGGIFEIVMPGMFVANFTGMACGMWVTTGNPSVSELMTLGFLTGLSIHGLFHLYDRSLHGEMAPIEDGS